MKELIIGILCCLGMAGTLFGYLQWTKKKYYNGKDQSSLSNTFYHTGWLFRALLISLCLWLFYPILLANGSYADGIWTLMAPYSLLALGKVCFAIGMGGIIGVALNAFGNDKKENRAHVFSASILAAVGCAAGCMLRKEWYIGAAVWVAWLIYYLIKQYRNKKAGNPNAWGLYIEEVAFYSVPTCLIIYILMNYFI